MKLYEITKDFQSLFDQFDMLNTWEPDTDADGNAIDEQGNIIEDPVRYKQSMLDAWFDTLEGIEGEFDIKAENIAVYIKNLKAESAAIKAEEKSLKLRRERKDKTVKNLTDYLMNSMNKISKAKIETPKMVISIRNNAESLIVDDEIAFVKWAQENNDELLKYSMPEIRKTEVKKLFKVGVNFPYVHLERSKSLIIK